MRRRQSEYWRTINALTRAKNSVALRQSRKKRQSLRAKSQERLGFISSKSENEKPTPTSRRYYKISWVQ